MRCVIVAVLVLLAVSSVVAQQPTPITENDFVRVEADPASGFSYPYYYYLPPGIANDPEASRYILVIPNNSGQLSDDFTVHESDVRRRIVQNGQIGAMLKTAVVIPVFPRPQSDWQTYTHALDRDTMLAKGKLYARPDLQLIAMIDDARKRMRRSGVKFDRKVLITGFSASGMFTNRFTFLHPDRVRAAAVGSPGGWPIAPVAEYDGKTLRYPIGVADISIVAGRKFNAKALRRVPILVFMGDADDNDSVPFGDSYDDEDRTLIVPLLGKMPVDRWNIARSLYERAGLNAEFKLYPGVKHTVNREMLGDIRAFFERHRR